jgi:hypothetical protein
VFELLVDVHITCFIIINSNSKIIIFMIVGVAMKIKVDAFSKKKYNSSNIKGI